MPTGKVAYNFRRPQAASPAPDHLKPDIDTMDATSPGSARTSVLFVCLGNICRSPLAEGVFEHLVADAGLADAFEIDSAGTGAWHVGEPPDGRASMVASQHGIELRSKARKIEPEDFDRFDYVIGMDHDNMRTLVRMAAARGSDATVELLRSYEPDADGEEVPDPYYGGGSGFETVYQMVKRSCEGLLEHIRSH